MDYYSINVLDRNNHNIPIILPIRTRTRQWIPSTRNNDNNGVHGAGNNNDINN
jgi:hypothetical protein